MTRLCNCILVCQQICTCQIHLIAYLITPHYPPPHTHTRLVVLEKITQTEACSFTSQQLTPVNACCIYNTQHKLMHVSHNAAGAVTRLASLSVSGAPLSTFSPLTDSILYSNLDTFQSHIMAGPQTVSQHVSMVQVPNDTKEAKQSSAAQNSKRGQVKRTEKIQRQSQ